jgi:phytoene desaturase
MPARSTSGTSKPSIAIIGAGPGGLAAAILLLASGADVTIYERMDRPGGRTARLSAQGRSGTYHFDTGPTFFLMPYVLDEVFNAAGKRLADYVDLTRLDPMYRLVFGAAKDASGRERTLDCTQDLEEMARRIGAFSPADGQRFVESMRENRAKLAAFEPVLRKPFRSVMDCLAPEMIKALPHLAPTQSVADWLGKRFENEHVRMAMSFQTKYLGMSPFKCPSLFTILPFIEYEFGIWHPTGGCNALVSGMVRLIEELGGQIKTLQPIDELIWNGREARGVITQGKRFEHDHVVINADASAAIKRLIPESLRSGFTGAGSDGKIDGMDYSCSTFMLYAGVRGELPLAHHTIYISKDYQTNIRQIAPPDGSPGELSDDPSIYVHNPSAIDKSLAPAGCSSLYILIPTPNTKTGKAIDWKASTARLRQAALDRAAELCGFRLEDRIECEKIISPDDWRAQQINFGATFNLAHNLGQMLHLRPRHELPGVKNVWLVGGGTHPGSGLPVIFLSSQITAKLLCGKLGLTYAGQATPIATVLSPQARAGAVAAAQ